MDWWNYIVARAALYPMLDTGGGDLLECPGEGFDTLTRREGLANKFSVLPGHLRMLAMMVLVFALTWVMLSLLVPHRPLGSTRKISGKEPHMQCRLRAWTFHSSMCSARTLLHVN